jgi:hypothetical protein
MIVNVAGPIASERYLDKIGWLTQEFQSLKGVTSVNSLTEGPKNQSKVRPCHGGGMRPGIIPSTRRLTPRPERTFLVC